MTEARVRAVMQKVAANLVAFVLAGYFTKDQYFAWVADLTYLQLQEVLEFFEVQLCTPAGARFGLRYTVSSDGSVQQDSASGGLDIYGLASGTHANLYAHLCNETPAHVWDELRRRGWSRSGNRLEGSASEQRTFSSGGYGLIRQKLGAWP